LLTVLKRNGNVCDVTSHRNSGEAVAFKEQIYNTGWLRYFLGRH